MTSIASDTWIIGTGEARTAPARDDVSITELVWEAVQPALADAGTELRAIEGAVTASQDFWDGRTISSMSVNEIVGGVFGSEAKVAADACLGLGYALARVTDADQNLNLVVAHAKESQGDQHTIELAAFDPYYERAIDPDETIVAALQAQLLYAQGAFTPLHAARVVSAARSRSAVLPDVTAEEVFGSPLTSEPLHVLDRAPLLDAASAIVICDGDTRRTLGRDGSVRIVATASRTAAYWSQRAALDGADQARAAADDALALAGWSSSDLDVIELNAPYAHQHLMVGRGTRPRRRRRTDQPVRGEQRRRRSAGQPVRRLAGRQRRQRRRTARRDRRRHLAARARRPCPRPLDHRTRHPEPPRRPPGGRGMTKRYAPVRAAIVATGQTNHGRRFDASMARARPRGDRPLPGVARPHLRRHRRGRRRQHGDVRGDLPGRPVLRRRARCARQAALQAQHRAARSEPAPRSPATTSSPPGATSACSASVSRSRPRARRRRRSPRSAIRSGSAR